MKSIKPGRGPSAMGALGGIFAAVFGVIWTIAAVGMGAPWFFGLFGVCFVAMAIAGTVYNYKNATGKNRYSAFDIVDEHEESDPFNESFGYSNEIAETGGGESNFCPYCGAGAGPEFEFCNKC